MVTIWVTGASKRSMTGPAEAAYVVNSLVKPASVIASHANEEATKNGKVRAGTKTEKFAKMANMPVHVPLSGNTMDFDASGKCVNGCLAALN